MAEDRQRVLVAFVDAFGPTQVTAYEPQIGAFPHRQTLSGVLGYSSGALATVLTGATLREHGRMCLFAAREPDSDGVLEPLRWLGLLPRVLHERGRLRHLVGKVFKQATGLTGYVALHRVPPEAFRWLDLPERDDLFHAERIGSARTFLADARAAGLSVYAAPWQLPEATRFDHALRTIRERQPDLVFLYAAELDAALHMGGSRSARGAEVMERIARHLDQVRDAMMRGGGKLTTLVVGDHGMADVHTYVDPRMALRGLGARVFVDSTMLRVWGDAATLDRVRGAALRARFPGVWLGPGELAARAVPASYGQAMFLLAEGVIFAPSWVGGRVAGMHGYEPASASARAALVSDAPIPEACRSIADVAGIVRSSLGIGGAAR